MFSALKTVASRLAARVEKYCQQLAKDRTAEPPAIKPELNGRRANRLYARKLARKDGHDISGSPMLCRLLNGDSAITTATVQRASDGRTYFSAAPKPVFFVDVVDGKPITRQSEVMQPMRRLDLLLVAGATRSEKKQNLRGLTRALANAA